MEVPLCSCVLVVGRTNPQHDEECLLKSCLSNSWTAGSWSCFTIFDHEDVNAGCVVK